MLYKKDVHKILQASQENSCVEVSFLTTLRDPVAVPGPNTGRHLKCLQ